MQVREHPALPGEKESEICWPSRSPLAQPSGLATFSDFQQHVSQCRIKERPVQQQPYRIKERPIQQQPYMAWNLFFFIDLNGFACFISQHRLGCIAVTTKPQCQGFSIAKILCPFTYAVYQL